MNKTEENRLVTVCAECLRATCWHGIFYCDRHKTADVTTLPIRRLRELGREHPSYWAREHLEQYGDYRE